MINLRPDHPLYDFDMEVLALLAPEPRKGLTYLARLANIADDLGCDKQEPILEAMVRLAHSYGVERHYVNRHHSAQIKQSFWDRAELQTKRYLSDVYGDD